MAKRKKRAATKRPTRKKRAQVNRVGSKTPVAAQPKTMLEEIHGGSPPPEDTLATDEAQ